MKMLDSIDKGEPVKLYGDGSQAYDFVYVGDCASANVCAMKADTVDQFYNVGTGVRTSIKELAQMILELTGSKQEVEFVPQGLTFVKNRIGCPKKANKEIGFSAQVSLMEGLKMLIEWRNSHIAEVAARRAKAK
jgi:UDP-glucose 4-epimerase